MTTYKIFNKTPFVLITEHAASRGKTRCGVSPSDIRNTIVRNWGCAYSIINSSGIHEKWIAINGPTGKGTIIVVKQSDGWTATTIRDSNVFTQSERRNEKLKFSFGDIMRERESIIMEGKVNV